MQQNNTNIYGAARRNAGLTQERAAELLDLSVESVKAYETGQRVPPDVTVRRMAEQYGTPGLMLDHARSTDELGLIPKDARPRPMEQTALAMNRQYRELEPYVRRYMEIAEDGEVDESEACDLARVQDFVASFVATCLAAQCCEGAKKERPEAGTSKRSRSADENHKTLCGSIVAQFPQTSRKICAGKAVDPF